MFTKGHKLSVGNKGGRRKSLAEEIAVIKHKLLEEATEEALVGLARSQVYKHLNNEDLKFSQVKEMGLPIVLKGITDKVDFIKPLQIKVERYDGGGEDNQAA